MAPRIVTDIMLDARNSLACLVDELAVKTVDVLFSRNANDPPRHPITRGYLLHAGRNGRKLQVELQIRPPGEQYGVGLSADHCRSPGNLFGQRITNPPGDALPEQNFSLAGRHPNASTSIVDATVPPRPPSPIPSSSGDPYGPPYLQIGSLGQCLSIGHAA
ncbi:hypothetical protein THAOC_02535 [Thalassiosira oceanica]|uniref:Uncharacterized protein n=1 Tax=Thalassiosira oceanica TaxID=159749 RepID=K0TAK6_THAOC|nr:hypothetical protein THAOC_02535 [Thalassiosira oceanica]|eukprot:EJK75733.1 hypothetical protein THAOC_02535 [Thalassiosira oceanica]